MSNTDRYKRPDYFPKAPVITPRGSSKEASPKAVLPSADSPRRSKPDSPKEIAEFKGKHKHTGKCKKGCEICVRCSEKCGNLCIGGTFWTANRILFFFITALHPIIFWFYRNMALEATEGVTDVLEKSVNLIPTFMKEATTAVIKGFGPKQIPCILKNEKYAEKLREYIGKHQNYAKKFSRIMYDTAKEDIESILPSVVKNLYETFKQGGSLPRVSENIFKSIFRNTSLDPLTKMIKQSSILSTDVLSNQTYPRIDVLLKQLNQGDYKFESSLEPIGILGSVIKYPKHPKYHDDIIDRLEQEGVHIETGFLNSLFESFDEAMCESQFEGVLRTIDSRSTMLFFALAEEYNQFAAKLFNTRDKEFPYVNNSYVTLLITCIVLMIMFGLTPIIFRKFFKKLRELIGFKDEDEKMEKDARIKGEWLVTGENWRDNWESQFKKSKAKKSVKKNAKKSVKKSVKKNAKKSVKKSAKKSAKKKVKKSLNKSLTKQVKKPKKV
jgi:hypothetical protein